MPVRAFGVLSFGIILNEKHFTKNLAPAPRFRTLMG